MTDDTTHATETTTDTVGDAAPKATMAEFSHTNPHTGKAFGDDFAFQRGPAVAADGGERNAVPRASSDRRSDGGRADAEDDGEQTMRDVDHEHPEADAEDANRVFQRGNEEPADSV
ncbi:hypothetical protein ACFQMA_05895 [Halosimplex aquaticum]|uniref:Uncharacterized protein n=1 Tax=Halosimplex aquaticum TaxID=3026162 RepID=A0ABD5Y0Y5_9EURY|nr:hypothetical protein [Halosimplex aquaticum]